MISVVEARDIILSHVRPVGVEKVDLFSALDRVLAEDVEATRNQPPWDNSAMDGYAVRSSDTQTASETTPVVLRIVEHLPAGKRAKQEVQPGQTVHIMTGAPIPSGADSVVRAEDAIRVDDTRVRIVRPVSPGADLRRVGEDMAKGERLLSAGTVLRPAEIGLLASNNRSMVSVYRHPRVAILSTGDEIMDVGSELEDGKIIDSNGYTLPAMVMEAGCEPIRLGISPDTRTDLEKKLREGLMADVILTSGGVSVGEFDFVKAALDALGTTMEFWKVAMTPGRPLAFGRIQDTLAFGLPGNPVASMVTFELFVRPALLKMRGMSRLYRPTLRATLMEDIRKMPGRKQFFRMCLIEREGKLFTLRTGAQGSGILRSMSLADGLAITHEHQELLCTGEEVEIMPLGGALSFWHERSC
ncbi:MAG: molybdopterin molybdotransferase MoeA [candidate division Zixibacteria bacterium]|nr:molybdopterin molybdotransferase MoeA [candidate division Zixibacteria bacterium]